MRHPWTRSAVVSLLATSLIACGDSTGPDPQELVDVLLDFCSDDTPVFFAVQNTPGGSFERVLPNAEGTVSFQAGEKFTLAIVHQDGNNYSSEYVFAAPADIEPLNGVSCVEEFGTKSLNGTVAGMPAGSAAMITMGGAFDYIVSPTSGYVLAGLPPGPLDLIAQREAASGVVVVPERVIVRRAQDRTSNSTIPELDFNSNEAADMALHSFNASGVSGADDNVFLLQFHTPTTRGHAITPVSTFTSGSNSIYGIPAALTQAGDLHELQAFADAGATYRGEVHYYRNPGTRAVTLGATLANPQLTTESTSPHLRLRTRLQSQFEYGSLISVAHVQSDREVILTATNSYFGGTPIQWDVVIPDMSGFAGFPSGALLVSGAQTDWFVDAYGGTAAAFFGQPTDGTILHFAGRAFSTDAMQLSRTRGSERSLVRSRHRGLGAY